MAEREEGIWGGEASERPRQLSYPTDPPPVPGRVGSEWGLASLLTGGVCLLLCPGTLIEWSMVISVHDQRWSRADMRNICVLLISCEFFVLGLAGMALAFGIVGLAAARKHQTPLALPLTGLVVSSVTLLFWIVIIVTCFAVAFSLV